MSNNVKGNIWIRFIMEGSLDIAICWALNFNKWKKEEFEVRYGSALEGLKKDQRSSLSYHIIFILRRFALVLVVTIGRDHLFL